MSDFRGMLFRSVLPIVFFAALLSGCSPHVISQQLREEAAPGLSFPQVLQNPSAYVGKIVIWGGSIIDIRNRQNGAVIRVLEAPLDHEGLPGPQETTRGRFLAEVPEFQDPEVFRKGREITIAGEIVGSELQPLNGIEYRYPVVRVKELHLWQEVRQDYTMDPYFYWGPQWYFGPPPFGPYPYLYNRRHDYHRRHHHRRDHH